MEEEALSWRRRLEAGEQDFGSEDPFLLFWFDQKFYVFLGRSARKRASGRAVLFSPGFTDGDTKLTVNTGTRADREKS